MSQPPAAFLAPAALRHGCRAERRGRRGCRGRAGGPRARIGVARVPGPRRRGARHRDARCSGRRRPLVQGVAPGVLGRAGAPARAAVERYSRARAGGLPWQRRGRARLPGGQRRRRARRRCRRPSQPLLQRGRCGHAPSETKRCCAVCRGAGASVRWVTSAALGGPGRQRAPGLVQSEVLLVARGGLISLRLAQGGLRAGFWWH